MKIYKKLSVLLLLALCVWSCKIDMPEETETSFETMIVKKSSIETPIKFSAKMKGQSDVTISPQVSGQLMKICVTEGQQVNATLSTSCRRHKPACNRLKPMCSRHKPACSRRKPTYSRHKLRPIAPNWSMKATRTSLKRKS